MNASLRRQADRYLDAARTMRASQLLHRPRRLVPPAWLAAGPSRRGQWLPAAAGIGADPAPQSGPQPPPESSGAFSAVGSRRGFPAPDFWTDERDGLLFLFHLHGFAELARYAAGTRTADGDAFWIGVLEDWLRACGDPRRPAWHPFPTSGRIVAWCAALSSGAWPSSLAEAMGASLERQLRLLRRSIEHDIGGNHVLRNAAALIVGGICMGDEAAERRGLRVLERALGDQLLGDGGHEERSPSYHRAVLADLRDVEAVLSAAARPEPPWLGAAADRMAHWLDALAGPDGTLPLLNDAWEGPGAESLEEPVTDLADSGYIVLRANADQAILDVGPLAPPHLPPHAHADALSFVLWADGAPVVIDPGTFAYAGHERSRFRGTAAHATVEVDGRNQCDLWGPFRAAHMPEVRRLVSDVQDGVVIVAAEHDGYTRLPDPVRHRRTFVWLPGDGLVVVDRLLSRGAHRAVTRLPLAREHGPVAISTLGEGPEANLEPGERAPYLGVRRPAAVLARRLTPSPGAPFGWSLLRAGATAMLDGDRLIVDRRDRGRLSVDVL